MASQDDVSRTALPVPVVNGKKVGEGKVAATAAMVFCADDGCDVGVDTGSPVSPHLVSPHEAVRIAMARH